MAQTPPPPAKSCPHASAYAVPPQSLWETYRFCHCLGLYRTRSGCLPESIIYTLETPFSSSENRSNLYKSLRGETCKNIKVRRGNKRSYTMIAWTLIEFSLCLYYYLNFDLFKLLSFSVFIAGSSSVTYILTICTGV